MELKNLILIENNKSLQMSNVDELIKHILGDNYYNLPKEKQIELMELNLKASTANSNYNIAMLNKNNIKEISTEKSVVIYDEITYILSLVILNRFILLEKKDSDIFTKNLDKSSMPDNYIILNTFAKKLLKEYIERISIWRGENVWIFLKQQEEHIQR